MKTLTLRAAFLTYAGLALLLLANALIVNHPLGGWQPALSLVIPAAQMSLVFLFFMRLKYASGLVRIFACAGFFWLAILGTLFLADYATRGGR